MCPTEKFGKPKLPSSTRASMWSETRDKSKKIIAGVYSEHWWRAMAGANQWTKMATTKGELKTAFIFIVYRLHDWQYVKAQCQNKFCSLYLYMSVSHRAIKINNKGNKLLRKEAFLYVSLHSTKESNTTSLSRYATSHWTVNRHHLVITYRGP